MPEATIYIPDPREPTTYAELPGGDLGGGSGGVGVKEVYLDRDPLPPDDPTQEAVNYRTDLGSWTQWSVASQAWF